MSEIDLIPAVYRQRRRFVRWLKTAVICLVLASTLIGSAFAVLKAEADKLDEGLRLLQLRKDISAQRRGELEGLNATRQDLNQQLELLSGLRSGAAAVQMFTTMDQALGGGDVWFTNWAFRRAGTPAGAQPDAVHAGYFVVVNDAKSAQAETWMIETQMKIDGEAVDHAALSSFVSNLIEQPEIQDVRVVRTETIVVQERPLVRFSLDVVVAPGAPGGSA
jgi:hypothetical protein